MSTATATAANYSYTMYETIDDVDLTAWNALRRVSGDPFMDVRFVRAVERSMGDMAKYRHVIFRDEDGQPAASACLCLYRVDVSLLADEPWGKIIRAIGSVAPRLVYLNVLFCGLPVSAGQSNLRFAVGVDTAAILRQLDVLLCDIARRDKARCIVLKEFDPEECTSLATLEELGYRQADSLPMNHTSPDPRDFEDYLGRLPSKKRYPIRKAQKKFETAGLRVVQLTGGEGVDQIYSNDVHKLYEAVLYKAKVKLERLPPAFFRELAVQMPDETAFTFIYDGDRVVAFGASLFSPAAFHQMFVGVNYDLNPQVDLYFNLFFNALDFGFRRNVSDTIICGQSADEFKHQKLGCRQTPLAFFVKGIDWSTRLSLRHAFHILFPPHACLRTEE